MPEGLSLEGATKLGEEVSEQYAVSPARFYVKRIIRPKYRLADGRIITAPMPVIDVYKRQALMCPNSPENPDLPV